MDNKKIAESLGFKLVEEEKKEVKKDEVAAEVIEISNKEEAKEESSLKETKESQDEPSKSSKPSEPIDSTDSNESVESQEDVQKEPTFDEMLLEKSDGKIKSYDDLEKVLSDKSEQTTEFANEQVAKLNEFIRDGGDIQDFISTQTEDYSQMSDLEIIKKEMKFNDSDLTNEDINLLLNSKYNLNEDDYDEGEIRLSKLKLRQDAKKTRQRFVDRQEKYATPKKPETTGINETTETIPNKSDAEIKAAQEKEVARWNNLVNKSVDGMENVDFEINEKGDKFSYKLTDDDKSRLKKVNNNLGDFWSRFMNEDGSENIEKLSKTMFMVDNFEKIIRSVASQYKSSGKEDVLKDIKNPSFETDSKPSGDGAKTLHQQMYDAWRKNN